jgi:cellulose synthase/poly-beta-1,6-N-acetylglucosamine synthase-like glycosyltransferase
LIIESLEVVFTLLTALMIAYLARHYLFTLSVLRSARKTEMVDAAKDVKYEPTVSILIPAHNEDKVIGRLLQRLTELTYPQAKLQVIVIDDGSSDATGRIADEYASRFAFVKVLQRDKKEGGKGKAAAMNAGYKASTGEIILCFDADYFPQKEIVEKLVKSFENPEVGAVQGRVVVLNEPQNLVTRLIALERIGGYRVDQEARDELGLIAQFGGTVGGFRRSVLETLGGWDESMLAEDTDLTFKVYLAGYKVRYNGNAECYEEAVDNWSAYRKQRYRWARGHMQCCFKHSLNVLKSKHLRAKEKIDGLLLLNVYFMPIVVLLSFIIGVPLMLLRSSQLVGGLWFFMPFSVYSFVGNFAPFFEVGIGAYLDGRTRTQWLIPVLIFTFFYNIPICTKALLDLLVSKTRGKRRNVWAKTSHAGNGNRYIMN